MRLRQANSVDIPVLLDFMFEFYAEWGYALDRTIAEKAFAALLLDERLGSVWLIEDRSQTVGYLVLAVRFAMEYSGMIACIDDLFVLPQFRNRGFATAALLKVREHCEEAAILAMTVEVGCENAPAKAVYSRIGFTPAKDRQLLALSLKNNS